MKAKILSIDKSIFNGDVQALLVPGYSGEIEILEGHADSFFLLKNGNITLSDKDSAIKNIDINGGLCKVVDRNVVILIQ